MVKVNYLGEREDSIRRVKDLKSGEFFIINDEGKHDLIYIKMQNEGGHNALMLSSGHCPITSYVNESYKVTVVMSSDVSIDFRV